MRYNRREFAVKAVERARAGRGKANVGTGVAIAENFRIAKNREKNGTCAGTDAEKPAHRHWHDIAGRCHVGHEQHRGQTADARLPAGSDLLSCVRALFASLIFLVGSAITTPQKLAGAVKDVKSYPKYLVTTLICVLLVQVSYLMTIDWTNSGTATVLQTLNLIFVLAWVCLRGKRLPLKRELVGVLLAFAGTFLIATGGNLASLSLPWQGLAWGLVDAVSTAAMSILPVVLMLKWGNMTINGITFLMSGLILCPFAQPWANIPALDVRGVLLLLYAIVCGTFLAFWLYMAGVMRVGAVRATMLGTSEPVMATITAVAWAGETFTFTDLTGFAMIIIMVFLVR